MRTDAPPSGLRRGRQLYVGGYCDEITAARAYDLAALKLRPGNAHHNFPTTDYAEYEAAMRTTTAEAWVLFLRRVFPDRSPPIPSEDLWAPPVLAEPPLIFR